MFDHTGYEWTVGGLVLRGMDVKLLWMRAGVVVVVLDLYYILSLELTAARPSFGCPVIYRSISRQPQHRCRQISG
jgi:hypothetical protein